MFDALNPALSALDAALGAGDTVAASMRSAQSAAEQGRDATVPMVARKGRASYLGERSAGHQDPGATSAALLFEAAADVLAAGT
jgi:dihydroxyacetone kinase-like protein